VNKKLLPIPIALSTLALLALINVGGSNNLASENGAGVKLAAIQTQHTNKATDTRLEAQYKAWQVVRDSQLKEQAEAAAKAQAAQQAQEQAQAAAARRAAPVTAPAPSGSLANPYIYRNVVTGDYSNGQALIDSCKGGVDVTSWYGVPSSAIEVRCGGSTLPLYAGAIIKITGIHAGTYRSSGIVATLNQSTDNTDSLPQGYNYLIQTCHPDSAHMIFLGLTEIA
jgi:hypothetical protein